MTGPEYGAPLDPARMREVAASLELYAQWRWPDDRADCPFTARQLRDWAAELDGPKYPDVAAYRRALSRSRNSGPPLARCPTCLRYCNPSTHVCKGDHPWANERTE